MNDAPRNVSLSIWQEAAVGALMGALVGTGLMLADLISPLAIIGVATGLGLGSGFNAWRRKKRDAAE